MSTLKYKLKTTFAGALVAAAIGNSASASPAPAATPSRQENIGLGSGLVIGALAGGPFGALAGAAAGAWLGDQYAKGEHQRAALTGQVAAESAKSIALTTQLAAANRASAERASDRDRYERLVADLHRLESDVPFRTNEAVLSSEATEHLRALGTVLAGLPQARVRVTGFADPRGTERQNVALSRRRANAVVTVLSEAGVRSEQMVIEARGAADASPDATTLDDYALERRASVRLEPDGAAMSAQR